jgi:hypothetical protein
MATLLTNAAIQLLHGYQYSTIFIDNLVNVNKLCATKISSWFFLVDVIEAVDGRLP